MLAALDTFPDVETIRSREPAVDDRHLVAEGTPVTRGRLRQQPDLGHQHDHTAPVVEHAARGDTSVLPLPVTPWMRMGENTREARASPTRDSASFCSAVSTSTLPSSASSGEILSMASIVTMPLVTSPSRISRS